MLAESGAIIEYLLERHGNGRLVPARGTNEHVRYLHWMHFAEGTTIGKLCPTGGVMGGLHGMAAFETMGHSLPLTAITMIANERLSNTIAARSPLARSAAPAAPTALSTGDIAAIASVLAARPIGSTQPR